MLGLGKSFRTSITNVVHRQARTQTPNCKEEVFINMVRTESTWGPVKPVVLVRLRLSKVQGLHGK